MQQSANTQQWARTSHLVIFYYDKHGMSAKVICNLESPTTCAYHIESSQKFHHSAYELIIGIYINFRLFLMT